MTLRRSLPILLILCLFLLAACGDGLVSLRYEDGRFLGGEHPYIPASGTYEPTAVGEPYAYYKRADITLYAIGSEDPTLWLTEAYNGGATTVFYADTIALPGWEEFSPDRLVVCVSDTVTFGVCEITDPAAVAEILDAFLHGEAAEWPLIDSVERYELKFASAAWPQFYMNLIYGEFPEGIFLYERATRRAVEIGDLMEKYLHPDAEGGE